MPEILTARGIQIVTDDRHKQITILEMKIAKLEDKVERQAKLIKLLQWQIKELGGMINVKEGKLG